MSRLLPLLLPALTLACAADKPDEDDDGGGDDGGTTPTGQPLALLLVVDNSASMVEQAGALARALPALDAAALEHELRFALTTPSADPWSGATEGVDPGEVGTLVVPARSSAEAGWRLGLTEDLLCTLPPWRAADVPSDPAYACEDAAVVPDLITQEYLDCLCGFGAWESNPDGSGREQHLEAVLLAGCRLAEDPPAACTESGSVFNESPELRTSGWPGEDVVQAHALVVSDEGDDSWRVPTGDEDGIVYVDALATLPVPLSVSAALPPVRDGALPCNDGGATTWGLARIEGVIASTDGVRGDISEPSGAGECAEGDLEGLLDAWVRSR